MKKFIKENWFKIIIVVVLLVVASAYTLGQYGYYQKQQAQIQLDGEKQEEELKLKIELEKQNKIDSIKDKCIDEVSVLDILMETREITNFRIANDRGCYLEAGCMKGVTDEYFKPKFNECTEEYYKACLIRLNRTVDDMIESEKQERISKCIKLYSINE